MEKHIKRLLAGYNAVEEYVIAAENGIVIYANPSASNTAELPLKGAPLSEIIEPGLLSVLESSEAEGFHLSVPDSKFLNISCSADVFAGAPSLFVFKPNETIAASAAPLTFRSMAGISSEFRAPITSLFTSSNLLRQRLCGADEKTRSYLSIISQNCYRLIRFSNNLLDLSRASSHPDSLNPENTDLVSFTRDIVEAARPLGALKGIPINFESPPQSILLGIDREKMERLILNLLSNSLKYTRDNNAVQVKVGTSSGRATISITDRGTGISDELLPYAFNAYRLTSKTPAGGYGLGLYLVRAITLLHGGTVMLETREGQGTTVIVSLPVTQTDAPYTLKQLRPRYDYAGNLPHTLLELCDVLSSKEFEEAVRITGQDIRQ